MNKDNWDERNNVLKGMAQAMAAERYPYSGYAMVCLPNGSQITRQEYWDALPSNEKEMFMKYAYSAYCFMGGYGVQAIIALSTEEYLDEK